MTRRIKRTAQFELQLDITVDTFINTPRISQRQWLMNRVMKEAVDELQYLDSRAETFIRGSDSTISMDRAQATLDEQDIMEDWQIPIMQHMANCVAHAGSDVLEVGFGRGVAADFIQANKPRSHTIIECNDRIVQQFAHWQSRYPGKDTRMLHGMWQDCIDTACRYDGILFHTYPLSEHEFVEHVVQGVTFAEHFFATARTILKPDGVLTYLTNEVDSLSRAHQRALFAHFGRFTLSTIDQLDIPDDTRDSLWARQMVMISVSP